MQLKIRDMAHAAALASAAGVTGAAFAELAIYHNQAEWSGATGAVTELTFNDLPGGTIVTTQYANSGIVFTDGDDGIFPTGDFTDGYGLIGDYGMFGVYKPISANFDGPRTSVAVLFPGIAKFELYSNGQLVGETANYHAVIWGSFLGIDSTVPFDRIKIWADGTTAAADSLFFGAVVPAPSAWVLLAAWAAGRSRRRRG